MKKSQNGFEIAEKDLELRGSGEIMGTKQYGAEDFKFFDYHLHKNLAKLAIKEASEIIQGDSKLKNKRGKALKLLLKLFKKTAATNLLSAG
jgi:ATP-dependent DNA helicase RecG